MDSEKGVIFKLFLAFSVLSVTPSFSLLLLLLPFHGKFLGYFLHIGKNVVSFIVEQSRHGTFEWRHRSCLVLRSERFGCRAGHSFRKNVRDVEVQLKTNNTFLFIFVRYIRKK
ncbi:hypothetical protein NPIL_160691 [Nephila pilipes]|uniref:Uncharacterized protein n=1 Tax=Nephila pilipes TaxID=299642 RepID=A0A8X6T492_NEPPI|nr:hypothetical protein NPIL_160691 [Nephila pilipes]